MKGIQVRWPRWPWNRASPSNPATRKYSIEIVADIHIEASRCTIMLYPHTLTNSKAYASLQCVYPQPPQCCISWSLDWKGRPYSMACEVTWPESPSLFSMGISKVICVWDPSRNGHEISCQNCSCLWYYSKHIRDICQGMAESCMPMLSLHWG